jgi:phosphoribosylformylglycinamidine (FGAM) synthase PurS component
VSSKGEILHPNSPTVPNHAHTLGFSHAIKLGTLFEILLAANTLSVTETSLS